MRRAQATVLSSRTRRSGLSLFNDSVECLVDGFHVSCLSSLMKPRQTSSLKTADGVSCNWPRVGVTPAPGCHYSGTDGFVPSSILKPQNPAMRQILGQYGFVSGTYPAWLKGRFGSVRSLFVVWLSEVVKKYLSFPSFWMVLAFCEHDSTSMSLAKFASVDGFVRRVFGGMS